MSKTVLVLGATGLVGRECVAQFAAAPQFERVTALVRRSLPASLRRPDVTERVVDFDRLQDSAASFSVSHIVCALGTTIKTAGSQAQFRRVDYEYPLAAARIGVDRGARHFLLVSALGANATSRVFYSRVKGELEDAIRALSYQSITIVRPSLLLGPREELRIGEVIGKFLAPLAPRRYKPVAGSRVAAALVQAAIRDAPGVTVMESHEIP
jgi:uncharacterized protein YbjT (DUF2867 family)